MEPDLAIYPRGLKLEDVKGPDILLAVEVAVATLGYDRGVKAQIYARHGVRELWVIDARQRIAWIHTQPSESGWGSVAQASPADVLRAPALPAFALRLEDI